MCFLYGSLRCFLYWFRNSLPFHFHCFFTVTIITIVTICCHFQLSFITEECEIYFQIDKLLNEILTHLNDQLTHGAKNALDDIFEKKCNKNLYPVVKLINKHATKGKSLKSKSYGQKSKLYARNLTKCFQSLRELQPTVINGALSADTERLIDFDCVTHRPNHLVQKSLTRVTRSLGTNSTRRLSRAYYNLHEYLCATCGAARLRFSPAEFIPLLEELQSATGLKKVFQQAFYSIKF